MGKRSVQDTLKNLTPREETILRMKFGEGRANSLGGAGSLLHEMNPQKLYKKGGAVKSASSRADGIAQRGKTKGRMV